MPKFIREVILNHSAERVFAWHARPGAFERLSPPWQSLRLLRKVGGIESGAELEFEVSKGPVKVLWQARHQDFVPDREFTDVQIRGPFRSWTHRHRFESLGTSKTKMIDEVDYELPLGGFVGGSFAESELERLFSYRHATLAADLAQHDRSKLSPKRILISGASGLVGKALCAFLSTGGHDVYRLVRRSTQSPDEVFWDPEQGVLDPRSIEGMDVVINLSGENIAAERWSEAFKQKLRRSRLEPTQTLVTTFEKLSQKPNQFVSVSAIGFYGDRSDEFIDESAGASSQFLGKLCVSWESAALRAQGLGINVVTPRLGVVLTPQGGALEKMLGVFRLGIGGPIGSGAQYMSWIGLDDLLYALLHCIADKTLSGPVNATAPQPTTNEVFSRTLATVLNRPLGPKVPAFVIRTLTGEMADALLLASTRCVPKALTASSFEFSQPSLEPALRHLLGRTQGD